MNLEILRLKKYLRLPERMMRLFAHAMVKEMILYVNEFYFNKAKVHLVVKPSPLIFDSMSSEEKKLSNQNQKL